jgi:hypothetical protein
MSSNNVYATVPTFDGSNYRRWADRMQAYLQMQNLWGVTIGDETKPSDLGPRPGATDTAPPIQPTAAEVAEQTKLQRNWTRDNEAAIGAISLKIREDLWTIRKDTAEEMWDLMKDTMVLRLRLRSSNGLRNFSDSGSRGMKVPIRNSVAGTLSSTS